MTNLVKSTKTQIKARPIDSIIKFQLDDGIESLTIGGKEALADLSFDKKGNVTLHMNGDKDKIDEIVSLVPFVSVESDVVNDKHSVTLNLDMREFDLKVEGSELVVIKKTKADITLDFTKIEEKFTEIERKLGEQAEKIKEAENRIDENSNKIAENLSKINENKAKIQEIVTELVEIGKKIIKNEGGIKENLEKIKSNKSELDKQLAMIEDVTSEVAEAKKEISKNAEDIVEQAKKIGELQEKDKSLEGEVGQLKQKDTQLEGESVKLKERIKENSNKIDRIILDFNESQRVQNETTERYNNERIEKDKDLEELIKRYKIKDLDLNYEFDYTNIVEQNPELNGKLNYFLYNYHGILEEAYLNFGDIRTKNYYSNSIQLNNKNIIVKDEKIKLKEDFTTKIIGYYNSDKTIGKLLKSFLFEEQERNKFYISNIGVQKAINNTVVCIYIHERRYKNKPRATNCDILSVIEVPKGTIITVKMKNLGQAVIEF